MQLYSKKNAINAVEKLLSANRGIPTLEVSPLVCLGQNLQVSTFWTTESTLPIGNVCCVMLRHLPKTFMVELQALNVQVYDR